MFRDPRYSFICLLFFFEMTLGSVISPLISGKLDSNIKYNFSTQTGSETTSEINQNRKAIKTETPPTKTLILPTSSTVLGLVGNITTADISSFTQTQMAPTGTVEGSAAKLGIHPSICWATLIWMFWLS